MRDLYTNINTVALCVVLIINLFIFPIVTIGLFLLLIVGIIYIKRKSGDVLKPDKMILNGNYFTIEMENTIRYFKINEIANLSLDSRNLISFDFKKEKNKKKVKINHEKILYLYEYINEVEVEW